MQDIVVVAIARTVPEAIYLTETLEEAEIPVVSRNDNTQGLTHRAYETRICVPRALQGKALEAINAARNSAEHRSVEDAFQPEAIAETISDVQTDPVLEEMFNLREADVDTRAEKLETAATEWLTSGITSAQIARYLAAAGLDLEQADALMQHIRETRGEQIIEEQKTRYSYGMTLMILGGVIIAAQYLLFYNSNASIAFIFLPTGLLSTGLYMIVTSTGRSRVASPQSLKAPPK